MKDNFKNKVAAQLRNRQDYQSAYCSYLANRDRTNGVESIEAKLVSTDYAAETHFFCSICAFSSDEDSILQNHMKTAHLEHRCKVFFRCKSKSDFYLRRKRFFNNPNDPFVVPDNNKDMSVPNDPENEIVPKETIVFNVLDFL